ncbi:MAG TPA: ACP S-malonyltransferase [Thermoanaerobaculia bacterium]|nr:ACP S-malonyltransferase [Thermoanaerobaculia bacterium]
MTTVFQFPGQGSVFPSMGIDLAASWEAAAEVYDIALRVTGQDLLALAGSASRERLAETEATHLLTFAHSLAVHRVLQTAGIAPDLFVGHSLGHVAALAAASVLTLEEGFTLIGLRGRLLAGCCSRHPGGMLAVRGLGLAEIEAVLAPLRGDGALVVGAVNGRDEIVVSGDSGRIGDALRALKARGGAATPLQVAGAFHSPRMVPAARELAAATRGMAFRDPVRPVVSTLSGVLLRTGEAVREDLCGHVLAPVRWDLALATLTGQRVEQWIEVGPGKVLTGLARRFERSAAASFTSTGTVLRALCARLAESEATSAPEPCAPEVAAAHG